MKRNALWAATLAAILLCAAQLAPAQTLATDRQVLAPGTWRARTGQATVLAAEVRMGDGSPLQTWADAQAGSVSHARQLRITSTRPWTDVDDIVVPGLYTGRFSLAVGVPAGSNGAALWVLISEERYLSQTLIARGWDTVWTRTADCGPSLSCAAVTWAAWAEHDLAATGLTADQVAAAIAAQEGQQSSDVLAALLSLLLHPTGDSEQTTFSGTVGPTVRAENLGARLDTDDELVLRIDVQQLQVIDGSVITTFDPILASRARITALTDAGSAQLLDADAKRIAYPLRVAGTPAASGQEILLGHRGTGILVALGAAETGVSYRVSVSGLDESVDAQAVAAALQALPAGSVDGQALHDVPVSYGSTLPAVASSTASTLFVLEESGAGSLRWLRPAAATPTTNRNRLQIVAAGAGGTPCCVSGSATPDNYGRLLGGLERDRVGATNTYTLTVWLRESMLADLGIAEAAGVSAVQIGLHGDMTAVSRYGPSAAPPGPTGTARSDDGVTYVGYRTAPLAAASAPAFTPGTTYSVLLWNVVNNGAVNIKPAATREPAAWELPVPAPVEVVTTSLPAVAGRRIGDQILLRGGSVGSRTWTLYVLTPDETGSPGAWTRPS